ncbi:hypothetical protein MBLNU230_g0716t1 [Neophaeotheca triangularis]
MAPIATEPASGARALLRAARTERQIKHPHATYTSSGSLTCNLCELPIKSESGWKAHLHSTQHTLRLSRVREAAEEELRVGSKKRKLDLEPEDGQGEAGEPNTAGGGKRVKEDEEEKVREEAPLPREPVAQPASTTPTAPPTNHANADADYAALMGELDDLEQQPPAQPNPPSRTSMATATYSSAPMTAEQLAATSAAGSAGSGNTKKDTEADEKVEASAALAGEFELMEGLEARLRRLRERKEGMGNVDGVVREDVTAAAGGSGRSRGSFTEGTYGE